MHTSVAQENYLIQRLYVVFYYLDVFGSVVLCLLDILGSILIILVLKSSLSSLSGFRTYVTALAIVDGISLLNRFLFFMVMNLSTTSNWLCKGFYFIGYLTTLTSYILKVLVSLDRILAVSVPYKIKVWSTPSKARINIIIFTIITIGHGKVM